MDEEAVKVLVVEDDEDDYVFIRDLLAGTPDSKYVVEWVSTYEKALERILHGRHQVCLLDYRLGNGNGLDILRKAMEGGCRSSIILITGWGDHGVDLDAMRFGAMDYLLKSQITGPLLDRSIRYALERRRNEEALRRAYDDLELRVRERTAELAAANAALLRNSEEVKQFAYAISHDLKNPVIAVHGFTQRLMTRHADSLDEKGMQYCDRILNASTQILALVDKVNAYITARESGLNLEEVHLKEVFEAVREEYEIPLRNRGVRWRAPETAPHILADRLSLVRILRNFVDNALKYGGDGMNRLDVGYLEHDGYHVIRVRDNGAGLGDTESEKIFDPFYRSGSSLAADGSGLGLAIVKELARQHGGEVWAENDREGGAAFFVSIAKDLDPRFRISPSAKG